MRTRSGSMYPVLLLSVILGLIFSTAVQARVITDMAGRKVTVPDKITKIYAAQPYTNVLLYMVAPDLAIGMQPGCLPFRPEDEKFFRKEVTSMPKLSGPGPQGATGETKQTSLESILKYKPDFALITGGMKMDLQRITGQYDRVHMPVVIVNVERISAYPAAFEFLGKLLNRERRGNRLAAYTRRVFAQVNKSVANIPQNKRVRVYYAESADGLVTESDRSFHADAIRMAGGDLVHRGDIKTHQGMEKLSLEQVLLYDPDVIISQEPEFLNHAYRDPRWQKIKAIANHRVYIIPRTPFNWIDRPPSVMRVVGVQWLANRLYPQYYKVDIRKEIRDFHMLFMGVKVSNTDLDEWLK